MYRFWYNIIVRGKDVKPGTGIAHKERTLPLIFDLRRDGVDDAEAR